MNNIRAAITAVAGYVPDYVLTNAELETMVDTSDEWITSRTGIKERRILKGEGKGTSVLGAEALKKLCEKRGIEPKEIDLLIVATITPDMMFPTTSNIIAAQVGLGHAPSFDMSAACTGFIYGLETAVNFIKSGNYKKVALIGADKMSSITNYKDRNSCILFGDAAAAVLLEPTTEDYGVMDTVIHSDGNGKNMIYLKGGGSAYPPSHETVDAGMHYFYQDGKAVFKVAVTNMADIAVSMMERNNLSGDDVSYLVPHQANKRIIEAVAKRMGVSMDKVTMNIERYGNTTAATIPLCLWEWEDKFKKGDNIILAAFGGGFTWGASYIKWAI